MDKIEKVLIGTVLIGTIVMLLVSKIEGSPALLKTSFAVLTFLTLITLITKYLIAAKWSIYSLAFFLLIIEIVGAFFKIQHWPGAGILISFGLLSHLVILILLIRTGILNLRTRKSDTIYNFIVAGLILLQGTVLFLSPNIVQNMQVLNYIILGTIMTMKLKEIVLNELESKVLTIIAIQMTLIVISDTIKLMV